MSPYQAQPRPGRLHLELPAEPGAPAAARRALETLPLGDRAEDVLLLASELVTNAVVHGGATAPIELTASCGPGCTRVEVRDHGRGFGAGRPYEGYGLHIVAGASARWGIRENGATCVWFEISPHAG